MIAIPVIAIPWNRRLRLHGHMGRVFSQLVHADKVGAGPVELSLTNPIEGGRMQAAVVYPSRSEEGTTTIGPVTVAPRRDAPAADDGWVETVSR